MSIHPEENRFTTWTLADRMRKSLDVAGVEVQEMAEYLEVTRGTIGNWINGRNKPQAHVLKLWAMRTGAPLEWLKTGETKNPPTRGGGGMIGQPSFLGESNSRPFHYKQNVVQFPGELTPCWSSEDELVSA